MFDLRAKQDINRGFSEAMGRGIDLALTPVVVGLIGWGIDSVLGTWPVFAIVFGVIGVAGTAVKIKLGYDRDMSRYDGTTATTPRVAAPAPLSARSGDRGPDA